MLLLLLLSVRLLHIHGLLLLVISLLRWRVSLLLLGWIRRALVLAGSGGSVIALLRHAAGVGEALLGARHFIVVVVWFLVCGLGGLRVGAV